MAEDKINGNIYFIDTSSLVEMFRNLQIDRIDRVWEKVEELFLKGRIFSHRFVYDEITIKKCIQLPILASKIGVTTDELVDLNPELRFKVTPESEYCLKLPKNKGEIVLASIEEIPKWVPPNPEFLYHRVRKGETLSHIAMRYKTSIKKIMRANNIKRANRLRIGQRLKIPLKGANLNVMADLSGDGILKTYRVKKGDCAYDIAKMYGMGLKEFLSLNNLSSKSVIYPGQKLLVRKR